MFIVCGEALMDVFAGAATPAGLALDARIGGSPLNVAIGLARLGQPAAFLGGVSTGTLGERLMAAMQAEGVATDCVERLQAPTTLSLVGVDARGVPDYAFYGTGGADRLLSPAALDRIPAAASAFHFGSYAMVVSPTAATQRLLIEREHRRHLVSYDPNVRLNVAPDVDVWRAAIDWMLSRAHVIKVSDEDLGLLYPGSDPAAIARGWLARGPRLVVMTRGAQGALVWTPEHQATARPATVAVVDTVGAGDTFMAALLTRLAELGLATPSTLARVTPMVLADVIQFATQAAAITCSRRGADLPHRHEVSVD